MVTFVNLANFLTFKYQKYSANWTPMNIDHFHILLKIYNNNYDFRQLLFSNRKPDFSNGLDPNKNKGTIKVRVK